VLKGLQGKAVVVTGAAGGIGAALCRRLSEEGARVVASDIDGAGAEAIVKEIGADAVAVQADVSTAEGAADSVAAAVNAFGRLDLYAANAGVESTVRAVADFDLADYQRVFAVNVQGAFLSAQAAVRQLTAQGDGGGVLFTASVAALMGTAGTSVYNASKHAVHGLARCLALEVASLGIRVNVLAPGVVDTRMMRSLEAGLGALGGIDAETFKGAMSDAVPLGRYSTAEEIAATAAWILSDEVPYMHGEVVTVSGGLAPY
jgi:NAD(P)-dependent dehydrogenase (short-subunit alcohol dehydrogenase family)